MLDYHMKKVEINVILLEFSNSVTKCKHSGILNLYKILNCNKVIHCQKQDKQQLR
jgi:signal recognition particle receptor subunit beta